eukprot:958018-Rhodomonas_salina.1
MECVTDMWMELQRSEERGDAGQREREEKEAVRKRAERGDMREQARGRHATAGATTKAQKKQKKREKNEKKTRQRKLFNTRERARKRRAAQTEGWGCAPPLP